MKLVNAIVTLITCVFFNSSAFAAATAVGQVTVHTYPQPSASISVSIKGAAAELLYNTLVESPNVVVTEHAACDVSYVDGQGIRCFLKHASDTFECGIRLATDDGAASPSGGVSCIE